MIAKNKLIRYLALQKFGITNMLDLPRVHFLTLLSIQDIKDIQANYQSYLEYYGLDLSEEFLVQQIIYSIPLDKPLPNF